MGEEFKNMASKNRLGQVCYFLKDEKIYYYYLDEPDNIYEYCVYEENCNS